MGSRVLQVRLLQLVWRKKSLGSTWHYLEGSGLICEFFSSSKWLSNKTLQGNMLVVSKNC